MYLSKRITFFQLQEDFHLTSSESRRSRPAFQQMRHMLQRSYPVLPSLKSLEDYRLCWKTFQKESDKYLKMNHLVWMSICILTWFSIVKCKFIHLLYNQLPSLVVVYVACLNIPADKPVYRVRKPSFLMTPIKTDADEGLERSDTTHTCIRFFTRSSGCTKQVANILQ